VDGDLGKLFRDNTLEIDETYLDDVEIFGQILSAYILFHNEVAWPFRLDISNFFIPYKKQKWTPPTVNGPIGKAMELLRDFETRGGVELDQLPKLSWMH